MRVERVFMAALVVAGGSASASPKVANPSGPYPANTLPSDQPDTVPHTLSEALGVAYETNPILTAQRARLRSTDEGVPTALAGWRPTISMNASAGAAVGRFEQLESCQGSLFAPPPGQYQQACYKNGIVTPNNSNNYVNTNNYVDASKQNRGTNSQNFAITEYLYKGGATTAGVHQATNAVFAGRAQLIATEEQVLGDTINAYVTYVEDKQLLSLQRQNEQVLGDELRAVNDQFRVGELTRTDVAQAEAALAAAIAQRQTAEGTLQTAAAMFYQQVGVNPPADLADPSPLKLVMRSEKESADLAARNNPTVIGDMFSEAEAKDAIDLQYAALSPQLYLQGTAYRQVGTSLARQVTYGVTGTINLNVPIYQGGSEYAAIRQARQNYEAAVRATQEARRMAIESAVQSWDTLIAARASTASNRIAVRSAEIAVEGTERQALVGSATTQEVLIQQQNLLSAEISLVQSITSVVTASYGVASATGRLTARDLGLAVPLYDETAYYNAVRNRLWGTSDYAVSQPGR